MKALEFSAKVRRGSSTDKTQRIITLPQKNLYYILKKIGLSLDDITDSVFILKIEEILLPDGRFFDFTERLNGDQKNFNQ
jgi:hypothetical protein